MPKFELEKNDDLRPAALLCYTKGSHRVRKVQFFLTLFKRPLGILSSLRTQTGP